MYKKITIGVLSLCLMFGVAIKGNAAEVNQNTIIKNEILKSYSNTKLAHSISLPNNRVKINALDPDTLYEQEPNNDYATANPLPLTYFMVGTFTSYDVDKYAVTVTEPGKLVVGSAYGGSLMELIFGLYDSSGNILSFSDMREEGQTRLQIYDVQPGIYYVTALDKLNFGSGDTYVVEAHMLDEQPVPPVPIDTMPPPKPQVNVVDNNDTYVRGHAEPGSYVWVLVGNNFVNKGTLVSSNGSYSVKIRPIKAGTYVGVCAVDSAGNQSKYSELHVIDKTPPSVLTFSKVTYKSKYVSGKTEASATVQIKVGSKVIGKTTASRTGTYKVTIKTQKKGTKLYIYSTDRAKNTKTVSTVVK